MRVLTIHLKRAHTAVVSLGKAGGPKRHLKAQEHASALEAAMGPYVRALKAAGIIIPADELAAIEGHVIALEDASAKGDIGKALRHSRALLLALPGDPTTGPRPPIPAS
jgi:hypothetical protein